MPFARRPAQPLPGTTGLWVLGTVGLVAVAATAAAGATVLWRNASTRLGAVGIGPGRRRLRSASAQPPEVDEPVSVLIPVRHGPEPAVAAVRAALDQRGVSHLDIVVLDDGCPQETRTALRREFGDDPRVRILAAAPLPRGWSPRAHRSHQLAVAARGRILIFTEPSAPLGPHAAASVTALLRGGHLDLAVLDIGRLAPDAAHAPCAQSRASGDGASTSRAATDTAGARAGGRAAADGSARDAKPTDQTGASGGAAQADQQNAEQAQVGQPHTSRSHSVWPQSVWPHGVLSHSAWTHSAWTHNVWPHGVWLHGGRAHGGHHGHHHSGRFTLAVDADAYWRTGGYRAAADDPDPLALLRMLRRASGRVAVADGRMIIPPEQSITPLPPADPQAEAEWDSLHNSRLSLSETARRVLAALVGARP